MHEMVVRAASVNAERLHLISCVSHITITLSTVATVEKIRSTISFLFVRSATIECIAVASFACLVTHLPYE